VPGSLPSVFYRALGKKVFIESRTLQSPTLGNTLVCRVQNTWYRNTLGKEVFAESQTLGEGGARQRAVSGRLKLTVVNLCRGPRVGTRQRPLYGVSVLGTRQRAVSGRLKLTAINLCRGPRVGTRQRPLYRVPVLGTRQSIFFIFFIFLFL
jgi:hypothetical protein